MMNRKPGFKNDFCLVVCCALSITVITGVVFSLDGYQPIATPDFALEQANVSMHEYCARNGMPSCDMMLVDVSPAKAESTGNWHFEYYSVKTGPVNVEVRGSRKASAEPLVRVRSQPR